jgi:hypothetical protein
MLTFADRFSGDDGEESRKSFKPNNSQTPLFARFMVKVKA